VASAPFDQATTRAAVRAFIEQLAGQGAPDFRPTITAGAAPALPVSTVHLMNGEVLRLPDALSFVIWAAKDQILDRLLGALDDAVSSDRRDGLDHVTRRRRDTELRLQALQVEREIEAVIEAGETRGISIPRSEKANPIAVLSLSSELLDYWRPQ
jgi:hypothetical protein